MLSTEMNKKFAIENHLRFKDTQSGLCVADIANAQATARISLQGGHIMAWQPKSQAQAVIWLSERATLTPGKALRGGIPVCWPWFGPHPTQLSYPAHGLARSNNWTVTASHAFGHDSTEIELVLQENQQIHSLWPYLTRLSIRICVGERLKITLTTHNLGDDTVTIEEALHAYFHIGDIANVCVDGLDQCEYVDKVAGGERHRQRGAIALKAETDRVYVNTAAPCVVIDSRFNRKIHIEKSGSQSTVVWNPWREKAEKMADVSPNGWRSMVCVESANALENAVQIPAGATHTMTVEYWLEGL